ncbi:MAG: MotA/TolQ/ExbB proton channel family protein [Rubripirellula sp.]
MVEASERVHVFSLPRCLSVACLFGLLVRPVFYQGWLLSLFDAYSAFFVIGGTAAILLYSFEGAFVRFIPRSLSLVFCKNKVANSEFATIAKAGSRYVNAIGSVGSIIGFVAMLQNLSDPSHLGKGMAVVVLALLYGVVLSELVFIPLAKAYSESQAGVTPAWRNFGVGVTSLSVLFLCFVVLIVSLR